MVSIYDHVLINRSSNYLMYSLLNIQKYIHKYKILSKKIKKGKKD
jgi:hypothetical protein